MTWRIAVDTGGTFTDIVALEEESGRREVLKVNSTPTNPSVALVNGVMAIVERAGVETDQVSTIMHGTTAATNAVLEGKYSRMALIVTRGFRDILEIRRQDVPGDFGDITWWIKPERVVPLELVREVPERIDYLGNEILALDTEAVKSVTAELKEMGIEAIAVSFIHSYADPAHERLCRDAILEVHPDCYVSLSSDVIREYREYERTQGTCLNTGLMPLMSSYIRQIEHRLTDHGITPKLYIMKSSGGVSDVEQLTTLPLNSCLSGPAAGVVAATRIGPLNGHDNVLTLDVGGTSADIALIEGKSPRILNSGRIEDHEIKVPMIDMTTVGAGGGSIAWVADNGALRVGPESAGSQPGPMCYGRGGDRPTVTDAHLILGRVGEKILGGTVGLDRSSAVEGVKIQIAKNMGLTLEQAAAGILEIAIQNMISGIRLVSVSRGRDPRNFTLLPFGGGGPMHACLVADGLGIQQVLIPTSPGAMSAEGLLMTNVRVDKSMTCVFKSSNCDFEAVGEVINEIRAAVDRELARQGFGEDIVSHEATVEMRYVGQAYEIRVPLPIVEDVETAVSSAFNAFHDAHEDRYGFSHRGEHETEIVGISIVGFGHMPRSDETIAANTSAAENWSSLHTSTRKFYDMMNAVNVEIPVYQRPFVKLDGSVSGPCIIEQYDTTTVVESGWSAQSLDTGALVLTKELHGAAVVNSRGQATC